MNHRVIPRLDIKGPNLVKGIHLEGLRVLGKPWYYALQYYQDGADELLYNDVVASLYGRNNLEDIVRRTAENIFIPLTVIGGVRNLDDIKRLLRAGADKVGINTAATHNPKLLSEGAERFGSQCIVSSIEAKWVTPERCEAFTDNGREATSLDVFEWAQKVVELGAGEIFLTSIDRDGTGGGYDLELTRRVAEMVNVPVIACGGCGQPQHLADVIISGKADAISAGSIFHYNYLMDYVDPETYADEGNIEFIRRNRDDLNFMSDKIQRMSIPRVKQHLTEAGVACRF
jgi:cyclase